MNRTFKPNRQGITLLFVVSMIVLFLLLGTAFVVVANNFTDLRNVDSPLRSHDLLADQYGYGVRAFVSRSTAVAPAFIGGQTFIQLALDSRRDADPGDMPNNMCFDLLTLEPRRLTPLTPENPGSLDNSERLVDAYYPLFQDQLKASQSGSWLMHLRRVAHCDSVFLRHRSTAISSPA